MVREYAIYNLIHVRNNLRRFTRYLRNGSVSESLWFPNAIVICIIKEKDCVSKFDS